MKTHENRIKELKLTPHPEGGWFRETYRAEQTVSFQGEERAASTGIYFLLEAGQVSTLHRIDADELWHHYEGSALRIHVLSDEGYHTLTVGPLDTPGATPQAWVPAGAWFGAEVLEDTGYALVGCTVAPGFEFRHFELGTRQDLTLQWPEHSALIEKLTHN